MFLLEMFVSTSTAKKEFSIFFNVVALNQPRIRVLCKVPSVGLWYYWYLKPTLPSALSLSLLVATSREHHLVLISRSTTDNSAISKRQANPIGAGIYCRTTEKETASY
jgi:hypothetical protein